MITQPSRLRRRPGLERLEARDCPTTITLVGNTLVVQGDSHDNSVKMTQYDNLDVIHITYDSAVPGAGDLWVQSSAVKAIDLHMGGGNDQFSYSLGSDHFTNAKAITGDMGRGRDTVTLDFGKGDTAQIDAALTVDLKLGPLCRDSSDKMYVHLGTVSGADVSIKADLGRGNDTFLADLWGDLAGDAHVDFDVHGQKGADEIRVRAGHHYAGGPASPQNHVHVGKDATLDVRLHGMEGDDTVSFFYYGENDGKIGHHLGGGPGVNAIFLSINALPGSTGSAVAI